MGGGLELGVFPEQSTHSRSSPVPPRKPIDGAGGRGWLPRVCSAPACSHLPDSCPRVPAGAGAAVLQPSRFFYSSSPQTPAQSEWGCRESSSSGSLHTFPEWQSE